MFERIYISFKTRFPPLRRFHVWLDSTIGRFASLIIKRKISELSVVVHNLNDRILLYLFSMITCMFFLNLIFFLGSFLWSIYKNTHVGALYVSDKISSQIFWEYFFSTHDFFTICYYFFYSAVILLLVFSFTRFWGLNRHFYEHKNFLISIPLWTLASSKVVANFFTQRYYSLEDVFGFYHWSFAFIIFLAVGPTMQLVNFIVPEFDDLVFNPFKRWKRLKAEFEIHKAEERIKREREWRK